MDRHWAWAVEGSVIIQVRTENLIQLFILLGRENDRELMLEKNHEQTGASRASSHEEDEIVARRDGAAGGWGANESLQRSMKSIYYSAGMNHGTACGGSGADQRERRAAVGLVGNPDAAVWWFKSRRLGRLHVFELISTPRGSLITEDQREEKMKILSLEKLENVLLIMIHWLATPFLFNYLYASCDEDPMVTVMETKTNHTLMYELKPLIVKKKKRWMTCPHILPLSRNCICIQTLPSCANDVIWSQSLRSNDRGMGHWLELFDL